MRWRPVLYVKVYQPELKMGEFEHYRGVYCALCKQLGISRASLYRAFDVLEQDGAIRRSQKQIQVIDPDKLQH